MSIVSQAGNTRLSGRHKEALDLLASGNVRDALLILLELADADPDNHYVCLDLGEVVLRLGMNDQAVIAARRAIEMDTTDPDGFVLLARAQEACGQFHDAYVAMSRAVDVLRNPYRSPEALPNEEVVPPLVIADPQAIFLDFEIVGDADNLSLRSTCKVRGESTIISLTLSGADPQPPANSEVVGSGELEKAKLLRCLPAKHASVVGIFPPGSFRYTLFKTQSKK
ncbi:MAG TPA: hypothetical protein PKI32_00835 [Opitutales bacterium]|nr:hypothetical protein [Opitutales bacterium]